MRKIVKLKNLFQKSDSRPVKSRELIESRGLILINQIKDVDEALSEFEDLDFMSEAEERSQIKLAVEKMELVAQLKILAWVLE